MPLVVNEVENRRGLVLGLTLAELLLLLLFLLILALSFQMDMLKRDLERSKGHELALSVQNAEMEKSLDQLKPLIAEVNKHGALGADTAKALVVRLNSVERLQRQVSNLSELNSELSRKYEVLKSSVADADKLKRLEGALAAAWEVNPRDPPEALERSIEVLKRLGGDTRPQEVPSLKELKAVESTLASARQINPRDPPEALQRSVEILQKLGSDTRPGDVSSLSELKAREEESSRQVAAIRSERDKYERQVKNLSRTGSGLTYPSCWTARDGQTEYMFDVTIRDDGLIVKDATPARSSDAQMKLVDPFSRGVLISEAVFQRATQKVFAWSRNENCRFYSIIRDGTGPASKKRYKELRGLVEAHFYPLLLPVNGSSPGPAPDADESDGVPMGGPFVPVPSSLRARH